MVLGQNWFHTIVKFPDKDNNAKSLWTRSESVKTWNK